MERPRCCRKAESRGFLGQSRREVVGALSCVGMEALTRRHETAEEDQLVSHMLSHSHASQPSSREEAADSPSSHKFSAVRDPILP